MTIDELAEYLYDAEAGGGAWQRRVVEIDTLPARDSRARYRRIAKDVLERLHAEHYSDELSPEALGQRLVNARKAIRIDLEIEIIAPIERALDAIDGGAKGTIAERVHQSAGRLEAQRQMTKSAEDIIADAVEVLDTFDGARVGTIAERITAMHAAAFRLRANASFGKGGRVEGPPLVIEYDRKSAYPVQGALQSDRLDALEKRYETLLEAVNRRADEIDRIETILMQWEPLVPFSSRVASNMLAEIRARHDADFPKGDVHPKRERER